MLRYYILLLYCCYVVCENLDLPEGSKCSWKNLTGNCVSLYRCFHAVRDIEEREYPPICSYDNKLPIVCCTDCNLVNDTRYNIELGITLRKFIYSFTRLLLVNKNLGILEKSGTSKAKDKCLEYIHKIDFPCKRNSIVTIYKKINKEKNCNDLGIMNSPGVVSGGRKAFREEYPHMALLGYGKSIETAQWLCGGSIISERFILTAGHCLSSPNTGPVKYITIGILTRKEPAERWQRLNVKRAVPHPEYKPPSKYHDIALLETDKEIKFSRQIRPACLHVDEIFDEKADVSGWGATGHRKSLADTLRTVTLNKFSDEECSEYYPRHRLLVNGYNHTTQMCYGDKQEPKDTCEGDSGGPLQSQDHQECVYTILGVTSFGRQCGFGGEAGMYTRVAFYVPWIESIVWP